MIGVPTRRAKGLKHFGDQLLLIEQGNNKDGVVLQFERSTQHCSRPSHQTLPTAASTRAYGKGSTKLLDFSEPSPSGAVATRSAIEHIWMEKSCIFALIARLELT